MNKLQMPAGKKSGSARQKTSKSLGIVWRKEKKHPKNQE